jgi:hypothetical protein
MKTQNTTKSRKMLVKLTDGQGNTYSKVFNVEIPVKFDTDKTAGLWDIEVRIAKEFVKPYPKALESLASSIVSTQVSELDKIKILAASTLDEKVKMRFISDYNLATANRGNAIKNLFPKVAAYRAEKGLDSIAIDRFFYDFLPLDDKKRTVNPFQYLSLEKDGSHTIKATQIDEVQSESLESIE